MATSPTTAQFNALVTRVTALETWEAAVKADFTKNDLVNRVATLEAEVGVVVPPPPPAVPVVSIAATTVSLVEGSTGSAAFNFVVSRDSIVGASSVAWAVAGSGTHPTTADDFVGASLPRGTLAWAAGEKDKTITINVAGDNVVESDETFTVTLSSPSGCTLGNAVATGVILNDDVAAPPPPPPTGQPDATNTGATGTLTLYAGPTTITTAGAVFKNMKFKSMMIVRAANVSFLNCEIDSPDAWGIDADSMTGLVVDHVTFNMVTGANSCILSGSKAKVTNSNLSGADNGIMDQDASLYQGNYIHDLHPGPVGDAHVDGIQIAGSVSGPMLIKGNAIWSWDTSCIFIKNDWSGSVTNITIDGNWLRNQAGKQTASPIYVYQNKSSSITKVLIENNLIEISAYKWYVVTDTAAAHAAITWTNNKDAISGAIIPFPNT